MVETWIYVAGGVIIAIIVFTVAYSLISSSVEYSQRQNALSQFSGFYSDINTVCIQEINNSLTRTFSIPFSVRVVYATDDTNNTLPKVTDQIKNQQLSSGKSICLQFKDEQYMRCYPEPPRKLPCNITIPYMGALKETEDIWIKVSKILGGPAVRDYQVCIKKVGANKVDVYFDVERCAGFSPTTTNQTTTTAPPTCSIDSLVKLVDTGSMISDIQYLIQQPRLYESSWNRQTADYIMERLKHYGLDNVHFEDFTLYGQGRNVVGEIGSGSNVVIVAGGHRDSVPNCPAAVDNAAGAAVVMEAARVLASCKSSIKTYKIKFVLFDIEEYGMHGSHAYVNTHSGENMQGMINLDCIGQAGNPGLDIYRTATDLSNSADRACTSLNLNCRKLGQAPARSDQAPFAEMGIGYIWVANYDLEAINCAACYHCYSCQDDMGQIGSKNLGWAANFTVYVLADLYLK